MRFDDDKISGKLFIFAHPSFCTCYCCSWFYCLTLISLAPGTISGACAMSTRASPNRAHASSEVELTDMNNGPKEHEKCIDISAELMSRKADSFGQLNDARSHLEIIKQRFEYVKMRFHKNGTNTIAARPPANTRSKSPPLAHEPRLQVLLQSKQGSSYKSARAGARRRSRAVKENLRVLQHRRQMFAAKLDALQSALSRSKLRVVGQTNCSLRTKQHAQCETPMPLQLRKTKRWSDVLGTPPPPPPRCRSKSQRLLTPLPPPAPMEQQELVQQQQAFQTSNSSSAILTRSPPRPCSRSNKTWSLLEAEFGSTWVTPPPPPLGPPPAQTNKIDDSIRKTLKQREKFEQESKMNELVKKISKSWEDATRSGESARESAAQAQGAMRAAAIGVLRPISAIRLATDNIASAAPTTCQPSSKHSKYRRERERRDVHEVSENCHAEINQKADQASRLLETILDTSESGKIILEHRARNWHGGDVAAARTAMSRQMHSTVQKYYR